MFERCCGSCTTLKYEIVHKPQPIVLSDAMDEIIKNLLWYVPNIDSYQAIKNKLIADKVYDDFSFKYILSKMGMVEDRDVKWIEPHDPFDESDWAFYENSICTRCQKIIITRQKNLSKTNDLLRCLRNCIAHGHFAIVNDYIIGFNKHTTKKNPDGEKKAVIKIKPENLLSALRSLMTPSAKELLVAYAFEKAGYTVIRQPSVSNLFDLLIEKAGKQYAIELKDYCGHAYLHQRHLNSFLTRSEELLPGVERVLFIDTSRVTKSVREKEKEIENLRIVDLSQVKELLQDNPVDILAPAEE